MNTIVNCKLKIENCKFALLPRRNERGAFGQCVPMRSMGTRSKHFLVPMLRMGTRVFRRSASMAVESGRQNKSRRNERGAFGQCAPMRSMGTRSKFAFCILQFAFCNLIILAAFISLPAAATAASPGQPKIAGVRVGFADRYKAGLWTPVEVTLDGGVETLDGELAVIVPDGDGVPGRVMAPCRLEAGRETAVRLITRFGRVNGNLTVEYRVSGRTLVRRTFETSSRADGDHFLPALEFCKLYVVVGESDLGVEEAGRLGGAEPENRPVVARLDDLRQLPARWYGYEGIDGVVFSTDRPDVFPALAEGGRAEALEQWIEMGGRLVVSAGSRANRAIGPVRRWRVSCPADCRRCSRCIRASRGRWKPIAAAARGFSHPAEPRADCTSRA